jgi:hypothetical protein
VAHEYEVDVFALFFNLLYSIETRREGEDKRWWIPFKIELFVVTSFYKVRICNDGISFSRVFGRPVPLRVALFAWSAVLKKIPTMDNLRKMHVIVVDWCYMCKRDGESVNHLLLHYVGACAL